MLLHLKVFNIRVVNINLIIGFANYTGPFIMHQLIFSMRRNIYRTMYIMNKRRSDSGKTPEGRIKISLISKWHKRGMVMFVVEVRDMFHLRVSKFV